MWKLEEKTERNFKYRQRKTNSDSKQTNILRNKKPLKTDKTKNVGDKTKEDDSENTKGKLKDISNADKEAQILKQNRQTFWGIKNLLKKTRQKMLVTTPKKIVVRTPRKNWKIFQIQTKKQKFWSKTDKCFGELRTS